MRPDHIMAFDLNVILGVIISPNHTFAQIRDNDEKYFVQSIGLLMVSSVLSVFVILPFVMIPISDVYFEGVDDVSLPTEGKDMVFAIIVGFFKAIVSFVTLFYWKKTWGQHQLEKSILHFLPYRWIYLCK